MWIKQFFILTSIQSLEEYHIYTEELVYVCYVMDYLVHGVTKEK